MHILPHFKEIGPIAYEDTLCNEGHRVWCQVYFYSKFMGSLDEATRIGTINPQAIAKIRQRWLEGSPRRTVLRGRLGNVFLFNQQEL